MLPTPPPSLHPPLPLCLLLQDAGKRLGARAGADDIKRHPWFAGVNWALVRSQTPPFVSPNKASFGERGGGGVPACAVAASFMPEDLKPRLHL